MPSPANRLVIALAQIPSIVGDIAGNRDRVAKGARRGRRVRRRPHADAGALSRRLSAGGPGAEARLPGSLPRRLRGAGAGDGGRRTGRAARPALGRGRQIAQRHGAPDRGADRSGPVQGRPAELRRFRRKAGVRPGPLARPDRLSRRAHRRADLRGHLGARPGRMHPRDRRRDPARPQRLALRARQARDP